jgi:hypothetical protein
VSTRIAAILAALILVAGGVWVLGRSPRPEPVPDDSAALVPAPESPTDPEAITAPEPGSSEPEPQAATPAPGTRTPRPGSPGVRRPAAPPAPAPEGSLWSRLSDQVRRFLTPSNFDKDEDGRMDSSERESARDLIQQRRNRAREDQR